MIRASFHLVGSGAVRGVTGNARRGKNGALEQGDPVLKRGTWGLGGESGDVPFPDECRRLPNDWAGMQRRDA